MKDSVTSEHLENVTEEQTEQVVVQHHRLGAIMPIILFSYVGVLIRLGLAFLGNNQTPLNAAFWPNFVGCLIIGFVVEQKIHIQKHFSQLYIGLTTGLCGSITTFSGLMYDACVALFGPSSNYTYPVSNYLTVLIAVFASSFVGFVIGRHLSTFTFPFSATISKNTQWLNTSISTFLFPLFISLTIPLLILLACLLPVGHYTYFIYSVIFAPLGSLTRFVLSICFNFNPNFPYGTLLANVIGSYIYLGMTAIHEYDQSLSPLVIQIIISVIQGYCGCLTTVSTFILELDSMKKRRYMYAYFVLTILPIQIVYIILAHSFSFLCSPSS